jgi:major membrane immunogen (membrane-anchored lipoprotein)
MKKLCIILLMISLIGLTGCGIINPSELVLPDDLEFINLVESLDTPAKICEYMMWNFLQEPSPYSSKSPYELYLTKTGDCNDYATFGMFCANYHGYNAYEIIISYKNTLTAHAIAVYEENGGYTYSDYSQYFNKAEKSFDDVVISDGKLILAVGYQWKSYKVYDYEMNIIEEGFNALISIFAVS